MNIDFDIVRRTIAGYVDFHSKAMDNFVKLQFDLAKNMVEGDVLDLSNVKVKNGVKKGVRDGIILGKELSRSLAVGLGDSVSMISPVVRMTPLGLIPRIKIFRVVGLFDSGMYEYDSGLAFISCATFLI